MTTRNPGCGGAGLVPMVVTETDSYDTPVAVYRTSHPEGFSAKRLDSDLVPYGDDLEVHTDLMTNVFTTDKRFWATRVDGKWQVVGDGENYWSEALTQEAFSTNGMVELFVAGPIVECITDTSIASDTLCDVVFDDKMQEFKIIAQQCPVFPSEGY